MNKQELITIIRTEVLLAKSSPERKGYIAGLEEAINIIEGFSNEPQKPVVPQFVAEWIEKCKMVKAFAVSLSFALHPSVWEVNGLSNEIIEWLMDAENQDLFARAWLDGYTVEKEKYYKIEVKGVSENNTLIHDITEECWFFEDDNNEDPIHAYHTRKELEEAGFGWVFDCPGIEIEEAE